MCYNMHCSHLSVRDPLIGLSGFPEAKTRAVTCTAQIILLVIIWLSGILDSDYVIL